MVKVPDKGRDIKVLDRVRETKNLDTFTTSNGIKFSLRKVSPFIIQQINLDMVAPKPPSVYNADKERDEENPDDPDYADQLQRFNIEKSMVAIDTYFAFGTKVIELPDDLEPANSEDWSEFLIDRGFNISPKGSSRYVAWLRYYALVDTDDLNGLFEACIRMSGHATEVQVQQSQDSFRSDEGGGSNTQTGTETQS